jgi:hypothetical protein
VVYSGRVRKAVRSLVARAKARGRGRQVLDALRELDRRLHLYPQFGEPLIDLTHEPGQLWVGTIQPLVVRYAIYDDRRLVLVVHPILSLPGSGLQLRSTDLSCGGLIYHGGG